MGIFDFFKKKNVDKVNTANDDSINFVIDMWSAICEKCNYGDSIEKLNEYERVLFVTQTLEQEVNNGGFSQFFYNSSGNFSNELAPSQRLTH